MATQTELAEIWAEKEGIGIRESLRIISSLVDTMKEMLIEGDDIRIRGFMTAQVDVVEPRVVKNFMGRGKSIQVPERHVLVMRPSGRFKQQVQNNAV